MVSDGLLRSLYPHVASLRDWTGLADPLDLLDRIVVAWHEQPINAACEAHDLIGVLEAAHRSNIRSSRATPDGWRTLNVLSAGKSLVCGLVPGVF
jgi:hypothetical protein